MTESSDNTTFSQPRTAGRGADRAHQSFEPGQLLGGKFRIISVLGKGGVGTVFRVQQVFLNIVLALKVLDSHKVSDDMQIRRFQTEAKAAFSLNHPSLVKVLDFGLLEDNQPYLAMELIDGVNLSEHIKECGRVPLDQVVPIFIQACLGLAHAHGQSIIHRDIKPSNIMLVSGMPAGEPGSVKIVDFGIAKIATDDAGEIQALTKTGDIFGSPFYMSPEQCSGEQIDYRTDIYSLGCSLFEALTGTPPHVGTNVLRTMMLHQSQEAPLLKEASLGTYFPENIEQVVHKMLCKSPQDRYQSLNEVANDLSSIESGVPLKSDGAKKDYRDARSAAAERPSTFKTMLLSAVLLLAVAASVICVLLQALHSTNVPTGDPSQDRVDHATVAKSADTGNGEADSLTKDLDTEVKNVAQKSQTSKTIFAEAGPVASSIVMEGGKQVRKLTFPGYPIGFVEDADISPSRFRTEAMKSPSFPVDSRLMLEVGGDHFEAFENPEILTRIAPNEFVGLSICAPVARLSSAEATESATQEKRLFKILSIAAKWSNLQRVCINSLFINKSALGALDSMKKLTYLQLYETLGSEPEVAQHDFLKRLSSLTLNKCSATEIVHAISGSKKLQRIILEDTGVTAGSLKELESCENLVYLQFKEFRLYDPVVLEIAKLKHLQCIYLKDTPITPVQIRLLLKECSALKKILLTAKSASRLEAVNFRDARVEVQRAR